MATGKIMLQSKRDKRVIEVTPIQWQQMIENDFNKNWKVLNPESTKELEATHKKVEDSIADYILKKEKLTTKTKPILKK